MIYCDVSYDDVEVLNAIVVMCFMWWFVVNYNYWIICL